MNYKNIIYSMQGVYEAKVKNFKHTQFEFFCKHLSFFHLNCGTIIKRRYECIDIYWQRCAQQYSLSHVAPGQRSLT